MSRVVTNRGRQRFRVAVNGESLSDDLKRNSQGRNPRIREERGSANSRQRRESVMAVKIGVRYKAAIRRNAASVTYAVTSA